MVWSESRSVLYSVLERDTLRVLKLLKEPSLQIVLVKFIQAPQYDGHIRRGLLRGPQTTLECLEHGSAPRCRAFAFEVASKFVRSSILVFTVWAGPENIGM